MNRSAIFVAVPLSLLLTSSAFGASPLFPYPLHITRQVHDPISGKTTVLDEYGYGNRLASVRGKLTSIADYEKGELTEIDRAAGTYSVTRFDAIAKVTRPSQPAPAAAMSSARGPQVRSLGAKTTKGGRSADAFSADVETQSLKESVEVSVDRNVTISKGALEVLLGAAYPGVHRSEHDVVISAAGSRRGAIAAQSTNDTAAPDLVALPVEQIIRYDQDGRQLEFRTSVVRVANEVPPSDVLAIPAGARLVPSRIVSVGQTLDAFDHPIPPAKTH
jgi:hypothetical protein